MEGWRGGQCCGSLAQGCFHGRIAQESDAGARRGETLIKNKGARPSGAVHEALKTAGFTGASEQLKEAVSVASLHLSVPSIKRGGSWAGGGLQSGLWICSNCGQVKAVQTGSLHEFTIRKYRNISTEASE